MNLNRSIPILMALMLAQSPQAAFGKVEAGKYAKVYSGGEGVKVVVVDVKGNESKQKLIQVSGKQSIIDDVVLLHTEVKNGDVIGFETIVNDDHFWTIRSTTSRWVGKDIYLIFPENYKEKIHLYYDEKESKKVDGDAIAKLYEKSVADGSIRKIQLYSGDDLKPRTNRVFKEAVNDAKRDCSAPIGAKIDWTSVTSKHKKLIPIASFCRQPAELLSEYCDNNPKDVNVKKITGITCKVGASQNLTMSKDRRFLWQAPANKSIDQEALRQQLTKILKSSL